MQDFYDTLTVSEKGAIAAHYGAPEDDCKYTNLCVFVTDDDVGVCTTTNTGDTGGHIKPAVTTTKKPGGGGGGGGGGGNWNKPPGNGWGDVGGVDRLNVANWGIVGLVILTIVLK